MQIYNSLSKQVEEFSPLTGDDKEVGVYTCGPTVYFYPHIGNWRTFVLGDLVVRLLKYLGYDVNYRMNITDVGHLTGDNLGDSSQGEDRLEKGAKREGKTAWEVAEFYTNDFRNGYEKLALTWPTGGEFCKATDHIPEQIEMVRKVEEKGFAYVISDGVYFDVKAYEAAGNDYGLMSNIHKDNVEARVEENKEKRDARDFALWKFSPKGESRQMEWESPWGIGFPGWHIECSAMSTKYLGDQFDVHIGGEDHKSTHHPNEIAQAEAATGKKPFVKYWMHGAFLQVDGGRMGKSLGNAYTLQDVIEKGFDPLVLKYFYMTGHYRKSLNFTWDGLRSAAEALYKLWEKAEVFGGRADYSYKNDHEPTEEVAKDLQTMIASVENDLNYPQAMAFLHKALSVAIDDSDELYALDLADSLFGLELRARGIERHEQWELTNVQFKDDLERRRQLREQRRFEEADKIRHTIESQGYEIVDKKDNSFVRKKISVDEA